MYRSIKSFRNLTTEKTSLVLEILPFKRMNPLLSSNHDNASEEKLYKKSSVANVYTIRQVLGCISVSIGGFLWGLSIGWTSAAVPQLKLTSTQQNRLDLATLDYDSTSWISTWLPVGGIFGSLLVGPGFDWLGRKRILQLTYAAMAIEFSSTEKTYSSLLLQQIDASAKMRMKSMLSGSQSLNSVRLETILDAARSLFFLINLKNIYIQASNLAKPADESLVNYFSRLSHISRLASFYLEAEK